MNRGASIPVLLGLFLATLSLPAAARAHPLSPSLLEIHEGADGRAEVVWREPAVRASATEPRPVLPDSCPGVGRIKVTGNEVMREERWRVNCGAAGIAGRRIGVTGLAESGTDALVRIRLRDGQVLQRVLRGDDPGFVVPRRPGRGDVLRGYAALGVHHILTGPDHLLFLLGLMILATGGRALAFTITAFTAGHSLTLALAALGVVRVPTRPIELAIALTVFVLAVELTRGPAAPPTWMRRRPAAMAFLFGLLHGLGFAGALAQTGLPSGEIPLALFSFNLGIESGQILVAGSVLVAWSAVRALAPPLPAWSPRTAVYAMGTLSAFWCFQRAAAFLG